MMDVNPLTLGIETVGGVMVCFFAPWCSCCGITLIRIGHRQS